ncbi:MAG: hypothetical protein B1H13_04425 [Desulfobacteraceae bacterium 4484_190.3]|nr:MAG: hypothetical protein B1H13_04425 [Desulfobacteraceae bacterium 4484_190.3]
MGSSTVYHLMRADNSLKVCLIEKDPLYEHASSMLSMANVRVQFGLKENIQISQYTLDCLEGFAEEMEVDGEKPDIGHRKEGNLFVVDEQGEAESLRSLELQKSLGCKVEWWSPRQIVERYPLYDPGPYVGGTFGTEDGYLDPYAVVMGYKKRPFHYRNGRIDPCGKING